MLWIDIPETEMFDEKSGNLIAVSATKIQLEHSLVSLAKWESKWKKPFLGKDDKTTEEIQDYIKCMTITQNVNPLVYTAITPEIIMRVNDYINDSMTATWFNNRENGGRPSRQVITAEIIYYQMIALNIPFECQKWHLNRLLTLIRVCSIKNQPPKKMRKRDQLNRNSQLNAARRKQMNSKG